MNRESTEMLISFKAETFKMAWKESLGALRPGNLGLLLLVSLRALKDLYKALFYAWFLPTALLAGLVLDIKSLVCTFFITLIARAARPSIDLKKTHYWSHINFVDWILFFGLFGLVEGIPYILRQKAGAFFLYCYQLLLKGFFLGNNFSWLPGSSLLGVVSYFLSPFVILWVFFMLDSRETLWHYLKAFGRAFLMMIYNYPFFLVSYLALRLIISFAYIISRPFITTYQYVPHVGWALLLGVLVPFYICFIMSFYVKQLHEQFGLYYKS